MNSELRTSNSEGSLKSELRTRAAATEGSDAGDSTGKGKRELWKLMALTVGCLAAFHAAYLIPHCELFTVVFLGCLVALTCLGSARRAFNWGVAIGLAIYVPHLGFFWNVFAGPAANALEKTIAVLGVCALWLVLPIWLGVFLALATWVRQRLPIALTVALVPCVWTGVEYFRSELYPLKFSWLNVGYAFDPFRFAPELHAFGMYGLGFVLCCVASAAVLLWSNSRWKGAFALGIAGLLSLAWWKAVHRPGAIHYSGPVVEVAGMQLEFPSESEALKGLDRLVQRGSYADLLVLSEYTFDGPVPDRVKDWCRNHQIHLIVGGKKSVAEGKFYNTAFVVGPEGEIVFEQAKAVPIQFFNDGLPAPEQKVWKSPWGAIGLCICYDLSYTRVTDRLIRRGAQALIVPTMDVESWGSYEHQLHARVAPVRAAEYGVPMFRLSSSGVSQFADPVLGELHAIPFPGQGEILTACVRTHWRPRLPLDRIVAPICVVITATLVLCTLRRFVTKRGEPKAVSFTFPT